MAMEDMPISIQLREGGIQLISSLSGQCSGHVWLDSRNRVSPFPSPRHSMAAGNPVVLL
jgi:hypothetical protein